MLYRILLFSVKPQYESALVYIYPLLFETSSHLPPHPTPLDWYRAPFEFPEPYSKFLLAIYFTYGNVSFHVTLSIHLTLSSPLPMSISLFSVSISPLCVITQSCLTLCDPMDCSPPGSSVHGVSLDQNTGVYLWLVLVGVWQKTTKFCKVIILQLKNK